MPSPIEENVRAQRLIDAKKELKAFDEKLQQDRNICQDHINQGNLISQALQDPGVKLIFTHIDEEIKKSQEGWAGSDVDEKTSRELWLKAKAFKELLAWINAKKNMVVVARKQIEDLNKQEEVIPSRLSK